MCCSTIPQTKLLQPFTIQMIRNNVARTIAAYNILKLDVVNTNVFCNSEFGAVVPPEILATFPEHTMLNTWVLQQI